MKAIMWSMPAVAGLVACGVTEPQPAPERVDEAAQALVYGNDIFYDKFDPLAVGSIHGQAGWTGACAVIPGVAPDKNLACSGVPGLTNGQNALHAFVRPAGRNYHLQFDVWSQGVADATHGKLFLENPPGDGSHTILQLAIGCNNIRATFEYHANTTRNLPGNFPCNAGHYRVACIWHDGGTEFRCGAAALPSDPVEASFVSIPAINENGVPEPIGAFDRIRLLGGIGERTGTTIFDKVQVLSD